MNLFRKPLLMLLLFIPVACLAKSKKVEVRCEIIEFWKDGALAHGQDLFISWDVVHIKILTPKEKLGTVFSILIPSNEAMKTKKIWKEGNIVGFRIDPELFEKAQDKINLRDLEKIRKLKNKKDANKAVDAMPTNARLLQDDRFGINHSRLGYLSEVGIASL